MEKLSGELVEEILLLCPPHVIQKFCMTCTGALEHDRTSLWKRHKACLKPKIHKDEIFCFINTSGLTGHDQLSKKAFKLTELYAYIPSGYFWTILDKIIMVHGDFQIKCSQIPRHASEPFIGWSISRYIVDNRPKTGKVRFYHAQDDITRLLFTVEFCRLLRL